MLEWILLSLRLSDRFLPGTTTPCPFLEPGSEVRVRQILESSAVENASLSVLPLVTSNSDLENSSIPVSISVLPLDDSNFVFENAPAQVLFSSPVGAVSPRPGLPLTVSRTPSANFPILFPDREDSSLYGFSLVLSGSDLLSERVALPLDDFGSSSCVVPALCEFSGQAFLEEICLSVSVHFCVSPFCTPVASLDLLTCVFSRLSGLWAMPATYLR